MQDLILRILGKDFLRGVIAGALALKKPVVDVERDTLRLNELTGQLQLEWQAREIHPWDRDMSPQRQAEVFCEQTIEDAAGAIMRLFQVLPEIEAIAVRVVEPQAAGRVILSGTVRRKDLMGQDLLSSTRMRLKMLGVRYKIVGGHLDPLDDTAIDC